MKRCNRCGAENKDEDNFCSDCGAGLNNSKSAKSSHKNLMERFRDSSIFLKVMVIIVAVFIFLVMMGYAAQIFEGTPVDSFTEWSDTYKPSEFNKLDSNNDGALSFSEVAISAPGIAHDNLTAIFDAADKNNNGVLKGAEFDGYLHRIDKYYKDLENQQKAKEKEAQEKSNSSSSSSSPSHQDEEDEICPICGGDQFSEFYNPQYGEMDWKCDYCGEIFRSDDEFYMD